ncbi:uncharacterized protein A4U43_C01F12010 [Asparagus officinalis]|uniref:Uncharacterized protein n=1 Tax=Asparagus officinalis TaxID=4686 RepID=A0A5P1FNP0_ASPOF|nr:uncharacterized protein A4U43_C01F12010 [Asparagus officinalis]
MTLHPPLLKPTLVPSPGLHTALPLCRLDATLPDPLLLLRRHVANPSFPSTSRSAQNLLSSHLNATLVPLSSPASATSSHLTSPTTTSRGAVPDLRASPSSAKPSTPTNKQLLGPTPSLPLQPNPAPPSPARRQLLLRRDPGLLLSALESRLLGSQRKCPERKNPAELE